MPSIAIVFGTRPEAIKLFPVIAALKANPAASILVINTGQHREMCNQALEVFGITPDISLELMAENQTPADVLSKSIAQLSKVFREESISGVVVQGDTTTALGATLAAAYNNIPVAHVEAGLRTYDRQNPFPEELNRVVISDAATLHFAPTKRSVENLKKEGIEYGVYLTGNTVVDSVNWVREKLVTGALSPDQQTSDLVKNISGKIILVTGHRREHFDQPIRNLCQALNELLAEDSSLNVIYPVHLNPNIQQPVFELLGKTARCHLLPPLDYPSMIYLMQRCSLIITDSGGIQEEAPSLGAPVIVTRKVTERNEAIESGCATIVSLEDSQRLKKEIAVKLQAHDGKETPSLANPFGEGDAGEMIASLLVKLWS